MSKKQQKQLTDRDELSKTKDFEIIRQMMKELFSLQKDRKYQWATGNLGDLKKT